MSNGLLSIVLTFLSSSSTAGQKVNNNTEPERFGFNYSNFVIKMFSCYEFKKSLKNMSYRKAFLTEKDKNRYMTI